MSPRGKRQRWLRRVHRWIGLLLGLQVFAWLSGGLAMSLLPIDDVRGDTWVRRAPEPVGARAADFRIAPAGISPPADGSVSAAIRLGEPVWVITPHIGPRRVVHAADGRELGLLDAEGARAIAQRAHREGAGALSADLVAEPSGEARGLPGPAWRVRMQDRWSSHVYVDAADGRVLAVRNDLWRVFDLFWMLHIMDYGEREDINNPLLRAAAGSAWFLGLSGLWLLIYSFGSQRTRRHRENPAP